MKIISNTIALLTELAAGVLFFFWFNNTQDIEPLIGFITSGSFLLTGLLLKFTNRPRVVLHHRWTSSERVAQGLTSNNPPAIQLGIDNPEMNWSLSWNYILEIRNNSSFAAYDISMSYINPPPNTSIEGEFGKIEPFQPHEKREFNVKFIQNVAGTHIDADNYLQNTPSILTKKFKIRINYKDECRSLFITVYNWSKTNNEVTLAKLAWVYIAGILITLSVIVGTIVKAFQQGSMLYRPISVQNDPLIDIRIDPLSYYYGSYSNYSETTLQFTIQTSQGPYQILEDIKVDTFIVLQEDYFVASSASAYPTSEITEVVLDRRILDARLPEESGALTLKNSFILKGNKYMDLYLSKRKEVIAKLIINFPYKYEGKTFIAKTEVPFIVLVK